MELLEHNKEYTWDFLIEKSSLINDLAKLWNVKRNYLMVNTNFIKAVMLNNKNLAIGVLNDTIIRIEEVKLL